MHAQFGEKRMSASAVTSEERLHFSVREHIFATTKVDTLNSGDRGEEADGELHSPMPGKISALAAEVSARVNCR